MMFWVLGFYILDLGNKIFRGENYKFKI